MDLKEIRRKLDEIDASILELFLQRMALADQVAAHKKKFNLPVLDKGRERSILWEMSQRAGEHGDAAYALFTRLLDLSRARQNALLAQPSPVLERIARATAEPAESFPGKATVACQGVEGSNAQAACDKLFRQPGIFYVNNFATVFDAVASGLCQFGVVPIENSYNGSVREVYRLLQEKGCAIVRSTTQPIRHCLLGKPGAKLSDIRNVYSHPQALGQCSRYLSELSVRSVPWENTATAAKVVGARGDLEDAAIASPICAELYGLEVLAEDIQDSEHNYTRFLCIAKEPKIYVGARRISLMFRCPDSPGAHSDILNLLAAQGVNMRKLESSPLPKKEEEFQFFLELDADLRDPGIPEVLAELERRCPQFTLLGCYSEV